MTANAQSLNNKMDELALLIAEEKPLIISITETWGDEDINDGFYSLDGYNMYRDDG